MGRAIPICCGVKKNGQPCQFRGRHDGYCKFHFPHTNSETTGDCPICYEKMTSSNLIKTSCKHEFHRSCLERWTSQNSSCPLCRSHIENKRPTIGTLSQSAIRELARASLARAEARWPSRPIVDPIIYIDSHEQLLPYLNAPVEIHFTQNYWESS